jgi:hypothetical protein
MMKLEFKAVQRDLKEFKRATQRMSASIDPLWAKRERIDLKKQLKQWIKDVEKLQQILKTIPTSPDRLFKLADKGISLEPFETVENLEQRELLKSIRQIGKGFLTRIKCVLFLSVQCDFNRSIGKKSSFFFFCKVTWPPSFARLLEVCLTDAMRWASVSRHKGVLRLPFLPKKVKAVQLILRRYN